MELDHTEPAVQEIRRPDQFQGLEPPFSAHTFFLFEVIIKVFGTGVVAVFGLITNIINIVVFYRQGIFSNSSTLSLSALAVSDFCCCFLSIWGSICGLFYHLVDTSTWRWEVIGFMVFTSMRPLNMCTQITCCNTAFMAFERMISVTFPFKVKSIFTPKTSLIVAICIFIINFLLYLPSMLDEFVKWEFDSEMNVTYLGWQPSKIVPKIIWPDIHGYLNPVAIRFSLVFSVVFCNIIILWKVKLSQKFRKTRSFGSETSHGTKSNNPTTAGNGDISGKKQSSSKNSSNVKQMSGKDMKLLRIITTVSVVFSICYTIHLIHSIRFVLTSEFNVSHHWYLNYTSLNISIFFQILNSSTNIIIYYSMSSRFRDELHMCLKLGKR